MNGEDNINMNEMERAVQLRKEAELLEYKGRVKSRIIQLQKISQDPQYDQYLAQLMKDLENKKATPAQVEHEMERSYSIYRQRMSAKQPTPVTNSQTARTSNIPPQNMAPGPAPVAKRNVEFKIGANILSVIGAMFVLIAFVIFAFNFLNGFGQGICLYAAVLVLILLSELALSKKAHVFSHVITGIGVGGLYAANIANYMVLHTINGLVAMFIILVIAAITIFISRKNDSTVIRIISLLGCYICFFPINGFSSDLLNFLMITFTLLIINVVGAIFQNQKNQTTINVIHLVMHLLFSVIFLCVADADGVIPEYLVLYTISSFIFINILSLQQSKAGKNFMFVLCTIGNGICIFILFIIGNFEDIILTFPEVALFVHIVAEILMIVISAVIFALWKKEDGRKWAQLYYVAITILLLSSFSAYEIEKVIAVLAVFIFVKICAGKREIIALDCMVTFWTGLVGFGVITAEYPWLCWIYAAALIVSLFRIKWTKLFHEIVVTLFVAFIGLGYYSYVLLPSYEWMEGWQYPACAGILLLLMILCNHLPLLRGKNQCPYNITVLCVMAWLYLGVYICENSLISTIMMIIGALTIIIVVREKYGLAMKRKYLLLAGFLTYCALTSHYESPVIVSIFLMAIALTCVGIGFKMRDKAERICGLVMAIFVCLKLVVYDFSEVDTIYRVVVFLIVGIIALAISFIYIQLEKNTDEQKQDKDISCL